MVHRISEEWKKCSPSVIRPTPVGFSNQINFLMDSAMEICYGLFRHSSKRSLHVICLMNRHASLCFTIFMKPTKLCSYPQKCHRLLTIL